VNRPVSSSDIEAFSEGTIELTETAEEAVVAKQARVVEEVTIGKEVTERTETVRDKVRRTEVDVEEIPGETVAKTRSPNKL
jgi:stress response protein YsnF